MYFEIFRTSIATVAILAQVYLILRVMKIIWSRPGTNRSKIWLTLLVSVTIGALFLMNAFLMIKPVPWVNPPVIAQVALFYLPAVWSFGSILSAVLLFAIQVMGWLGTAVTWLFHTLSGRMDLSSEPDPDRRRLLRTVVGGLAAAPFVVSGYGAFYAGRAYEVKEVTLPLGRLLRIVQLTDIHAGIYMSRSDMRRYADQVIDLQPDLFVLTGDYISDSIAFLPGCLEEMARVRPQYGTFAALGNHDLWYGKHALLKRLFTQYRIPLLVNRHKVIQTRQGPIAIAGIDDYRTGFPDLAAAMQGLDPAIPAVLLSHRPEIFPEAAARGVALTLAGHYHGGQVKLSLPAGDFSLAHLRTPYVEGLHRINDSHLYVSAGIGTTFTPVRLSAPPEVTVVNLT